MSRDIEDTIAVAVLKAVIDNRECNYSSDGGDCTVHTYFPFSLWNRFNCPNERGQKLLDEVEANEQSNTNNVRP